MSKEKNIDFENLLKRDYEKFEPSHKIKAVIMRAAATQMPLNKNLKQGMIIPLFGKLNGFFAKAAVIAILIGSSVFALKFNDLKTENHHYKSPKLVDTSFNGFDTSLVIKQQILLN